MLILKERNRATVGINVAAVTTLTSVPASVAEATPAPTGLGAPAALDEGLAALRWDFVTMVMAMRLASGSRRATEALDETHYNREDEHAKTT